jgi:integrating conjugative element protein (TIGR03756 family)
VHPRDGFVNHPEDPKVAAVTAQRAADVVTRRIQPHVYLPMPLTESSCGAGCEPPGPVLENNPENSKWQMLSPVPSSECEVFGQNDLTWLNSWAVGKQGLFTGEDYVWNLWRRYRCCFPAKGTYIGAIGF